MSRDSDPSLSLRQFAEEFLPGLSLKTARTRIKADHIPHVYDHGHVFVKRSDAERWRDNHTRTPEAPTLRSLLDGVVNAIRTGSPSPKK